MNTPPETVNGLSDASVPEVPTADHLRAFLAGRDVACPGCGYNLRDLIGPRCPECGEELVLRVGLAEPRQAAMIAGVIALTAGAGLNGLLLGFLVLRVFVMGDPSGWWRRFVVVNGGGVFVEGAALILWLAFWRIVRRRSRSAKILLVTGCWLLTILDLLIFSLFIR